MKKFLVKLSASVEHEVEADDPESAAELALGLVDPDSGWWVNEVNEKFLEDDNDF